MLRQLALASFILLAPSLVSAQTAKFRIEEATIEDIQAAILRGELTSTRVVQLYLEPDQGVQRHVCRSAGRGPRAGTDHAHQECASAQCLDDFEFATSQTRKAGVRSLEKHEA